jgi:prephenate dehydrogenase
MDVEHSPPIRTVAIIGLGLIGGSLARDLAARGIRVLGWDQDVASFQAAFLKGIANELVVLDPDAPIAADVVVIAVPVRAAATVLRRLAPYLDAVRLITDAGSTKRSLVRAAEALGIGDQFVGSHPMTGDHRSGWDASREGMFDGAHVFLCPTSSTSDDAMRLARELWTSVGGRTEVVDADEHDARLAWASHLPHLVSFALGHTLAVQGIARTELWKGGRDVTRLAGRSPEMWTDIAFDNAEAIVPALEAAEKRLREIRSLIENRQDARLRDLLAEAREWHRVDP